MSEAQRKADRRISLVQHDVDNLESAIEDPHERNLDERMDRVGDQVRARAAGPWDEQDAVFEEIRLGPSAEVVRRALLLGQELRLVSESGPRVTVYDTDWVVHFVTSPHSPTVTLHIEHQLGERISSIPWTAKLSEADVLTEITKEWMKARGNIQGVYLEKLFPDLAALLLFASRARRGGITGDPSVVSGLIQIVDDYWVITDERLFPKDKLWYTIEAFQLPDEGWVEHIHNKRWRGESGIDVAIEIARNVIDKSKQTGQDPIVARMEQLKKPE
ncbi:hypothetical protein D7Z96_05140 [Pseudarthrobacter phenanthrenivorans]|uniref:Uncharacterized protein n=1 Tax=Pseudarthrobacter phenanthrenivorans TaxID=361575 RepID=A0A3B0G1S5_PSEPS|nr:hypothetical protein [Pseudarthrobacter phenanthrenivorans]RKO26130.1 hypothetical protein D7Z96_05140 [Pseudarthrobacter phenanthrenivorans]